MQIKEENDQYIVVEMTSGAGNKYEVGYPKSAGYEAETIIGLLSTASQNQSKATNLTAGNALYWVANGDSNTSRAAINIGITGGYVNQASSYIIYQYQINFANYTGSVFTFTDLTNDTYSCTTVLNGNHYINYNSSNPTIVSVT